MNIRKLKEMKMFPIKKYIKIIYLVSLLTSITIFLTASGCSEDDSGTNNNTGGGPGANEVFMQGNAFAPSSKTVAVGTTIKWVNKDGTTHNVIGNGFQSGDMGQNAEFTHQFSTAGTFNYHCSHHGGMTGVITVQ